MAVGDQYFVVASATGRAGGSTPATTNDGRDPIGFGLTTATYDLTGNGEGESHLSSTGGFTSYVWEAGDQIYLSGGAGITVGLYTILSKVDNDAILLDGAAGTDSTSDVTSSSGPWGDATDETTGVQHAFDTMSGDANICNFCADANYVLTAQVDLDTHNFTEGSPGIFRGVQSNGKWDGVTQAVFDGSGLTTGTSCFVTNHATGVWRFENMRWTGDPAETTRSAANNRGVYVTLGNKLEFVRCRIDWFGHSGMYAVDGAQFVMFIDSEVDHNGSHGLHASSSYSYFYSGLRSIFHHNQADGVRSGFRTGGNGHGGIWINCQFFRNTSDGLHLSIPLAPGYCIVEGCLFDNNTASGLDIESSVGAGVITNCSFTNNGAYGITNGGPGLTMRANAFNSNTSGDVQWTPAAAIPIDPFGDNVTAAPGYIAVTDEAADYRPDTTSPLINAGIELPTP